MRLAKLAVASVSPTVGAVVANRARLVTVARAMAADEVTLGAFPEQVIGGYPPEDLVQWRGFVDAQRQSLEVFAADTASLATVFVLGLTIRVGAQLFNCAAIVHRGRILGFVPKEKLPTYNVFYEGRTFSRGGPGLSLDAQGVPLGDLIVAFDFGTVAIEVCEDVWSPDGPMRRRSYAGAEVVVNVSASPYRMGVDATRREMLATRAADTETVLVYANAVGGQDGLIYDGGGFVMQNGRRVFEAPRFTSGWWPAVVDLDRTGRLRLENTTWRSDCETARLAGNPVRVIEATGATADRSRLTYPVPEGGSFFLPAGGAAQADPRDAALDDLFEALALGVKSYYEKTGAFRSLGLALSGGRDSMLTALVAWRAAQLIEPGPARVDAFYMPSRHSQDATRDAAETLAGELGIHLSVIPIDEATDREIEVVKTMLGGGTPTELTRQNASAASACGTGRTPPAPCSCRPAT
jgi:NAD+ synthase (glutamine-hydrolysing)